MNRGGAAAATWVFRGTWIAAAPRPRSGCSVESRRRRGCDAAIAWETGRGDSTATWTFDRNRRRLRYYDGGVFASTDFKTWTLLDDKIFDKAECPDFYPVPADCAGCDATGARPRPTHVHATSNWQLGNYTEGDPMTAGAWDPLPGAAAPMDGQDPTYFYAAKSFWDDVKNRRITWGWIRTELGPHSTSNKDECTDFVGGNGRTNMNSLARETTFDPLLQRLVFFPVAEYEQLRRRPASRGDGASEATPTPPRPGGATLADVGATSLGGADVDLGLPDGVGLAAELRASFDLPTDGPVRLGAKIATGSPLVDDAAVSIFVDFVPNANASATWDVTVGFDLPMGPKGTEVIKTASMPMKASDTSLELALWVDANTVEAFWQGGRSAWTVPLSCDAVGNNTNQGIALFANTTASASSATV